MGSCGEQAVYGTVGTPARFFLEWKEPYPLSVKHLGERLGRKPTPQDEQAQAQEIGLDARGFAIYGLLERRRPMAAHQDSPAYSAANRDLASLIDDAVENLAADIIVST